MFCHQVPFVDDENTGLVVLLDVTDQLPIDFADSLTAIKHHQNHIGVADRAVSPMRSIKVDVGTNTLATSQSRRVDRDHRFAIKIKPNVDTVSRRSGDFADDHPL